MSSKTINECLKDIIQEPKPIIFIDTCSILDLVRVLTRDNISSSLIGHSIRLYELLKSSPRKYWLLGSQLLVNEWEKNIERVVGSSISELRRNYKIFTKYKSVSLEVLKLDFSLPSESEFTSLINELKKLSKKYYESSILISYDNDIRSQAVERIINSFAPASKGKNELQDCLIVETALKCCSELRRNNFNEKFVFVTSNSKDYGSPGAIKSPLDIDFEKLNIEFASSLAHAKSILNL